jgi:anti-anti-sigma regulatory factor
MRLSLAAYLSRFPRIVSFDEQLGVLRVTGDEDRTTSGSRRRPISTALKATRDVIVDLSELNAADPSLMVDLACLGQRLRARGRTLSLRHPQPQIKQLIELVGLHRQPSVHVIVPQPGPGVLSSR